MFVYSCSYTFNQHCGDREWAECTVTKVKWYPGLMMMTIGLLVALIALSEAGTEQARLTYPYSGHGRRLFQTLAEAPATAGSTISFVRSGLEFEKAVANGVTHIEIRADISPQGILAVSRRTMTIRVRS